MADPTQGLTTHDFHPQPFINPRDVFDRFSRPSSRSRIQQPAKSSRSAVSSLGSSSRLACCTEDNKSNSPCVDLGPNDDFECCDSPARQESCEGDCDQCEDCFDDHQACDEDHIQCVDECDDCLDEHDQACGQHGQVCTEICDDDCDFSCFDCIDWNAFEKDKSLGLSYSVPLLDVDTDLLPGLDPDSDITGQFPANDNGTNVYSNQPPAAPINLPMHHQCLDAGTLWDSLLQATHCPTPPPRLQQQQPQAQSLYGCHPATVHGGMSLQQPLPTYGISDNLPSVATPHSTFLMTGFMQPQDTIMSETATSSSKICQWIMPCSNMCSASFASSADLKKHMKAAHCTKGTTKCSWVDCSASFASEAALTGHISKKHLTDLTDSDGPFKCDHPGCNKTFMYKQVRDDHLASHSGENKMYCHICKQFLNSEGSNFKRHMASHQPKHEHMICKYHHLGCKRRFPRLDNLRRHEGCCKFGKKAALHHHHYHMHVGHQPVS